MPDKQITFSLFTKPWKTLTLPQLGEFVNGLGFDGIELPVRPGYQVPPERVAGLAAAASRLAEFGVKIMSVAGPTDEATIAACAEAGVPIIRVMAPIGESESYVEAEARYRREYDALVPLLDKYGVTLGVQNHSARFVPNALGLRVLLSPYDPRHIAAVWDAAHEALMGSEPDLALDVIWPHLCMVNLKNAYWRRDNGPEAAQARWLRHWTGARQGLTDWPRVADELRKRNYSGAICLPAEYTAEDQVDRLIAQDLPYAKSLFTWATS